MWEVGNRKFVADIVTSAGDDSIMVYIFFMITALNEVANVLVSTSAKPNTYQDSIMISATVYTAS